MAAKQIVIPNEKFEGLMGSQGVQRLFGHQLPARLSYPLATLMRELQAQFEIFMDEKVKIIEKYCERDEKDRPKKNPQNQFTVAEEHSDAFMEEYQELLALETVIKHEKIRVDLGLLEEHNLRLAPREIMQLELILDISPVDEKKPAQQKVVPMGKKKKAAKEQKS